MEDLLSLLCDSRRVKRPCWLMLRKPMWYSKKHTGQGVDTATALQALSADGKKIVLFLHFPLQEIWVALPGKGDSNCKSGTTHSYQHLQYFPVSKQLYGCRCFRFLT